MSKTFKIFSLAMIVGLFIYLFVGTVTSFGQTSSPQSRINTFPGSTSPTTLIDNTGSSNTILYIGYARPDGPTTTWSVAGITLTNIVVLTNVGTITFPSAHGLVPDYKIRITGSATTAINTTYRILTVPSTTTATITTSGVADATYTTGLVISTDAPLITSPLWSISKLHYDSNGKVDSALWAGGNSGNYTNIWANRAVITGSTTIGYK